MKQYSGLSAYYDKLNEDFPYKEYADFIKKASTGYGNGGKTFVDFACGTGNLAIEFAKSGYDVTAFDISSDELSVADKKARDESLSVRFLCADMRSVAFTKKYSLGACITDSVNYLLSTEDVAAFFSSAYSSLENGGVFVFDVNTKYRFENVYSDNAYVLECEDALLAWQNEYNGKTKKCKFYLSLFAENKNGTYERFDEVHTEKLHSERTLARLINESGFEICGIFGSIYFDAPKMTDEKAYYILRKPQ